MMLYFLLPLAAYGAYPVSPSTCHQFTGTWETNGYAEVVTTDRCVVSLGDDGLSSVFVSRADGTGGNGFRIDWNIVNTPRIPNDGYTKFRPAGGVTGCITSWYNNKLGPWSRCPVPASDPNLKYYTGYGSGLGAGNKCTDASGDYEDSDGDMITLEQTEGQGGTSRCYNTLSSDGAYIIAFNTDGMGACTDCFMRGDEGLCSIAANKDISCQDGYTLTYKGPAGSVVAPVITPSPVAPVITPSPVAPQPACSDYDNDKKGCKKPSSPLTCKFKKLKAGKPGYVVGGPKKQGLCVAVAAATCADETKDKKCLNNKNGLSCCWDGACKPAGSCAAPKCSDLTKKTCEKTAGLTCNYDKKAGVCNSGLLTPAPVNAADPCLRHTARGPCNKDVINNCAFDRNAGCVGQ